MAGAGRPVRAAFLSSNRFWRGANSVFAVLARGLADRHSTIALVAYETVAAGFQSRNVDVRTLPVGHTTLKGARALRRELRALAADVVFVDRPRDIRLAAFAAFNRPVAIVYCLSKPLPPEDLVTRLAFRRVNLTVFLTDGLATRALVAAPFMRRAGHRVIPNGVDCDFFRPDAALGQAFRQRHRLGDGAMLLGVGALEIEKRWDLLLDSLAMLDRPAPPLLLCGTGALDFALRGQAEHLDLDVRFVGQLDAAQLVGAYNAATCIVHTRPDEVFSLALLEALACGRPVLAASEGGTPELLGDAGVLAPPENPRAFATLLHHLLEDAPRRVALAVAARQRAVERYSVERMIRDYGELLESLVPR